MTALSAKLIASDSGIVLVEELMMKVI